MRTCSSRAHALREATSEGNTGLGFTSRYPRRSSVSSIEPVKYARHCAAASSVPCSTWPQKAPRLPQGYGKSSCCVTSQGNLAVFTGVQESEWRSRALEMVPLSLFPMREQIPYEGKVSAQPQTRKNPSRMTTRRGSWTSSGHGFRRYLYRVELFHWLLQHRRGGSIRRVTPPLTRPPRK